MRTSNGLGLPEHKALGFGAVPLLDPPQERSRLPLWELARVLGLHPLAQILGRSLSLCPDTSVNPPRSINRCNRRGRWREGGARPKQAPAARRP